MKRLTLIRHAKSSWKNLDLDDYDRPLNKRGLKDGPVMGARLKEVLAKELPEVMITSGAVRAKETMQLVLNEFKSFTGEQIQINDGLYMAGVGSLKKIVQSLDQRFQHVGLVTHNSGITGFANHIQKDMEIFNIPTAGMLSVSFQTDDWKHVFDKKGALDFFIYPKVERVYGVKAGERKPFGNWW